MTPPPPDLISTQEVMRCVRYPMLTANFMYLAVARQVGAPVPCPPPHMSMHHLRAPVRSLAPRHALH